jgi:type III pantothenate kinase
MKKILCLDFGNTSCKGVLFNDNRQGEVFDLPDTSAATAQKLIETYAPDYAILSSVINHEEVFESVLKEHTRFYRLDDNTPLPFLNAYVTSATLGPDRIALAAAANYLYPGQHSLIVSAGTCITYNFIQQNRAFRGGAISPGIEMRFKALNEYTAKLPLVSSKGDSLLIGYDTETAIRSGVINGAIAEVDGIINAYRAQYPNINVLLTGGDMGVFESQLKSKIFADRYLLFKGLFAILESNAGFKI